MRTDPSKLPTESVVTNCIFLMEFLWGHDTGDINLKPLKEAISKKNASFSDMSQHDMVEFFVSVVAYCHVVFVDFDSQRRAGRKQGTDDSIHKYRSASSVAESPGDALERCVR